MTGDVYILVLDCLRRDYAEPYSDKLSTPALAQLAEDSFVLERAYSTSSWTIPAHGSLFTGKYPSQHRATAATKRLPQAPETIAEVAENCSYEPIAVSTNPWVNPDFDFYRGFGEHSKFLYPTLPFPDVGSPHDVIHVDNNSARNFFEVLKWSLEGKTFKRLAKTAYNHLFFEESIPESDVVTDKLISSINAAPNQRPIFGFANYMERVS